MFEIIVLGTGAALAFMVIREAIKNAGKRRTQRTIKNIHSTRDQAVSRMQSAHEQFIDYVNQQTQQYRRRR